MRQLPARGASKSMPGSSAALAPVESPRTPTSAFDALQGPLTPSPSIHKIALLSKAESQNIEIQLKGIKLRLPVIMAVCANVLDIA